MKMQQLHVDEIDAAIVGDKWLTGVARAHGATRIDILTGDKNGGIRTAWKGNQLLAYFVVVRDDANWSVLVCHDLISNAGTNITLAAAAPDLLAVVQHILRCIPMGGFAQIQHGSSTWAQLDAVATKATGGGV